MAQSVDAADSEAVRRFRSALKAGDEELLPSELVKRILGGENPTRVWREHRGLTTKSLAEKAGLAAAYLSQIESGAREGSVETLRNIARALNVTIDDLVG